ncbi:MAG: hypothetical protein JNJ77_01450 [Planctomycetia bacterium]|nr:hypothetical protein [Planctomycetia bacterium]
MPSSTFYQKRFTILLLMLICFVLLTPMLLQTTDSPHSLTVRLLWFAFSVSWAASATYAVSGDRRITMVAVLLMTLSLMLELLTAVILSDISELVFHLLRILFLSFIIYLLFRQIFSHEAITFDTISASICIYLLLGALWAHIYTILELATPGSIAFSAASHPPSIKESELARSYHMLYFSFVTLSTVGYGDAVPTTPTARMFASAEALIGQIYLLVMVSRLVGLQISQSINSKSVNKPSV